MVSGPTKTKPICSRCWAHMHGQHVCFDPSGKQGHTCRNTADHRVEVPNECMLKAHILMDGKSECRCNYHDEWAKPQAQKP